MQSTGPKPLVEAEQENQTSNRSRRNVVAIPPCRPSKPEYRCGQHPDELDRPERRHPPVPSAGHRQRNTKPPDHPLMRGAFADYSALDRFSRDASPENLCIQTAHGAVLGQRKERPDRRAPSANPGAFTHGKSSRSYELYPPGEYRLGLVQATCRLLPRPHWLPPRQRQWIFPFLPDKGHVPGCSRGPDRIGISVYFWGTGALQALGFARARLGNIGPSAEHRSRR